jgi:hypothetical protein
MAVDGINLIVLKAIFDLKSNDVDTVKAKKVSELLKISVDDTYDAFLVLCGEGLIALVRHTDDLGAQLKPQGRQELKKHINLQLKEAIREQRSRKQVENGRVIDLEAVKEYMSFSKKDIDRICKSLQRFLGISSEEIRILNINQKYLMLQAGTSIVQIEIPMKSAESLVRTLEKRKSIELGEIRIVNATFYISPWQRFLDSVGKILFALIILFVTLFLLLAFKVINIRL